MVVALSGIEDLVLGEMKAERNRGETSDYNTTDDDVELLTRQEEHDQFDEKFHALHEDAMEDEFVASEAVDFLLRWIEHVEFDSLPAGLLYVHLDKLHNENEEQQEEVSRCCIDGNAQDLEVVTPPPVANVNICSSSYMKERVDTQKSE